MANVLLHCIARVRVTVEVTLTQPWPPEATVEEVHRRAEREALEAVSRLDGHPFALVGTPHVEVVTTSRAR